MTATPPSTTVKDLLRFKYEYIIKQGNKRPHNIQDSYALLRKKILLEGIPDQTDEELEATRNNSKCSLRGTIWKLFLRVKDINVQLYTAQVSKGPSRAYDKIHHDLDRTFKHNESFDYVVPIEKLSRCLNAFVHNFPEIGYIQGMNVICGTLLYVLPEVEAFHCFCNLIKDHCMLYMVEDLKGVHNALEILGQILEIVDNELFTYLKLHQYEPPFLMHAILSLGTSTPPLSEVLKLWDFYMAFGIHMNVICTASQIILWRDVLLNHSRPCTLLRTLPKLEAEAIISLSVTISKALPQYLYESLIKHASLPSSTSSSRATSPTPSAARSASPRPVSPTPVSSASTRVSPVPTTAPAGATEPTSDPAAVT